MNTGYSQSPLLLKGALIYFGTPMLIPAPNIIVFQYNPDTMTRSFKPWEPLVKPVSTGSDESSKKAYQGELKAYNEGLANLSLPYDPTETFSLNLELDAHDDIETPGQNQLAKLTGVAARLAAIEMLLYPLGDSALNGLLGSVSVSVGDFSLDMAFKGRSEQLSRMDAPIVLFFWGPGRIVPVRLTSLTIEEQQYSPRLYPVRAKATVGLRVLTGEDLLQITGDKAKGEVVDLAIKCYEVTLGQKRALANANLINSIDFVKGLSPI